MYCTSIQTTYECMSIPETVDVSISAILVTRCDPLSGAGMEELKASKWKERKPSRRVGLDDFLKQSLHPKKLVGKICTKWDES